MRPFRSALSVFSWPFPTCSRVQAVYCPGLFRLHLLCSLRGSEATAHENNMVWRSDTRMRPDRQMARDTHLSSQMSCFEEMRMMFENEPIATLRITVASPEQIRSWSNSEIRRPETIDCRTLQPEKDGLFCERIFSPTQDWSCFSGKYQRAHTPGFIYECSSMTSILRPAYARC